MHYVLFLLLCFVWGTNFILMKKAMLAFDPVGVAVLRVAGGLLPLLVVWLMRREKWPLGREYIFPLLLVALFGYSWPFIVQPLLIQQIDGSGFIGMMVCFVPLLTILVSVPLLGIFPKPRQTIGVVIGLVCSGIILLTGREQHAMSWWLIALAASVPLFYAVTNTYIKRRFVGVKALPLTVASLAISTAMLTPVALTWHGGPEGKATAGTSVVSATIDQDIEASAPADSSVLPILCVVLLGVVGTGLGILIFNKLLQEQGPLFAGMVTYLIPLIALFWGVVDGERVYAVQLVAFAGVLVSVALVQFGRLPPSRLTARGEGASS